MPKELIFTSVPNGLKPGSSGYCTVARHQNLDHLLERELERLSFYEMGTGLKPVIHAYRTLSLASGVYLVLSRICYAGNDHTGRTNYLAHHLVFEESELSSMPNLSPVDFFMDPIGWLNEWPKGKQPVIYNDGEGEKSPFCDPSKLLTNEHWQSVTGNQRNVYEPIYRINWGFICEDGSHELSLSLIQELCSLPEVNYQLAWLKFSFTTFLQKSDNPSDFYFVCGPASGAIAGLNLNFLYLGNSSGNCFKASGSNSLGSLVPQHKETTFKQVVVNDELSTTSNRQIQETVQVSEVQNQNLNVVDYQAPTYAQVVTPESASNADAQEGPYQDKSSKKLIISAIVVVLLFLLGGASFLIIKFNQVEESEYTQVEEPLDEGIQTTKKPDTPDSVSIEKSEEITPIKTIPSTKSNEIEEPKTKIETPSFPAPDYPEKWILEQKEEYKDSLTEIVLVSSFNLEEIKNSEVYAWSKNNQKFEWQDTISESVNVETILASRTEIMKKGGFETEKLVVRVKNTGPRMIVKASSFSVGLLFDKKLTCSTYQDLIESVKELFAVCGTPKDSDQKLPSDFLNLPPDLKNVFKDSKDFDALIKNCGVMLEEIDLKKYNQIDSKIIDLRLINVVRYFCNDHYENLVRNSSNKENLNKILDEKNEKISEARDQIKQVFPWVWEQSSTEWNIGGNKLVLELQKKINEEFENSGFKSPNIRIAGKFPNIPENPKNDSGKKGDISLEKEKIKLIDEINLTEEREGNFKQSFMRNERAEKEQNKEKFKPPAAEIKWEGVKHKRFKKYIGEILSGMEKRLIELNNIKNLGYAFEKVKVHSPYRYEDVLPKLKKILDKLNYLFNAVENFQDREETWKVNLNGRTIIEVIPDK